MMKQATQAANKQYGGVGARYSSAKPSLAEDIAAQNKYSAGEFDRRKAAATNAYDIASTVDKRAEDLSNRFRSAVYDRQKLKEDIPFQQQKQETEARLTQQEQQQAGKDKMAQIQFASYTKAADRIDAMQNAYDKGILDMQLLAMAQQGQLETADVDRYFTLMRVDLNNTLQDIMAMDNLQQRIALEDIAAKGENLSQFISGLFGAGSAAWNIYSSDDKGNA
jgi:hypothetical protein